MQYILVALIGVLTGVIQASAGFGFALVGMALWPLVLPIKTAVVMCTICSFITVVVLALRLRRHVDLRMLGWPIAMALLASTVGVFLQTISGEEVLRRAAGAVLLVLAVYFFAVASRFTIKANRRNGIIAGLASGLGNGLLNLMGPPMVVYMVAATDDKMKYNANMQCFGAITSLYVVGLHIALGNVTMPVIQNGAAALVGIALGTLLGLFLFKKANMQVIKKGTYLLLAAAGTYMLVFG